MARVPLAGTDYIPGVSEERTLNEIKTLLSATSRTRSTTSRPSARTWSSAEVKTMSDHHQLPRARKIVSIDAEYLSGERFPYQEDVSLIEDIDLMAATPGDDLNWLEDIELLEEEDPRGVRQLLQLLHQDLLPDPEGREDEVARKVLIKHLQSGNRRDRAQGPPLQVPPARAGAVDRGLADRGRRLQAERARGLGAARALVGSTRRVIVIGAGLAGLAAADELHASESTSRCSRPANGSAAASGRCRSPARRSSAAPIHVPHDRELIADARRLGLTLVRKGTLYGDREPRGGEPVSRAQVVAAIDQIRALSTVEARMFMARSRAPVSAAAWRTRSWRGWRSAVRTARMHWTPRSCARVRDRSVTSTRTRCGRQRSVARALAEGLGRRRAAVGAREGGQLVAARGAGRRATGEAAADAAVVAVPASVIDAIQFDPPLPQAKVAAHPQRALRRRRRSCSSPCAHPRRPARRSRCRPLLVLHAVGRRRRAVVVRGRVRGLGRAVAALEAARGPDRWVESLRRCAQTSSSSPTPRCVDLGPRSLGRGATPRARRGPDRGSRTQPPGGPSCIRRRTHRRALAGLMEGALRSGQRAARDLLTA